MIKSFSPTRKNSISSNANKVFPVRFIHCLFFDVYIQNDNSLCMNFFAWNKSTILVWFLSLWRSESVRFKWVRKKCIAKMKSYFGIYEERQKIKMLTDMFAYISQESKMKCSHLNINKYLLLYSHQDSG